jgi:hypothetical protein
MKQIPLTQEKFALVDDEDYEFLMQWKWYFSQGYAARGASYVDCNGKSKTKILKMHRVLLNPELHVHVDHINGNALDNQKVNLRLCTHGENMKNSKIRKTNTSGFKGVYLDKRVNRFVAQISINGKRTHIGSFKTAIEAAIAYNEKAKTEYGKFANLNKI